MEVIKTLREYSRPISDDDLARLLGADVGSVTRECRNLAFRGLVIREQGPSGTVLNRIGTDF